MEKELAVAARHVTFRYSKLNVLNQLDLEITRGTSFGLLGPNGSGKTTLIRLLVGILKPQGGEIRVLGQPPSSAISGKIGYMPQLAALYNELSVTENIAFFADVYDIKAHILKTEVEEVIKLVNLWDRRRELVMNLSGGMKQRVSLACALVHKPALLLLDEPTVGLDPELRVTFWQYFQALTKRGVTLVISSHTMDDAGHCDALAFLREGRVIAQGTPAELKAAAGIPGADLEQVFLYFSRKKESPHVP